MNPSIIALLQAVASLLMLIQGNPQVPQATVRQTVAITTQAIQIYAQAQAMPKINFPITKNDSIWPNIKDLYNTAYLDVNGNYVAQGAGVNIVSEDTSFGDINGDGFDDAAIIVQRTDGNGGATFALAAMLNQGGIMFNIADVTLGSSVQVFSHRVAPGGDIVLDMQIGDQPRATYTYQLFGNALVKI